MENEQPTPVLQDHMNAVPHTLMTRKNVLVTLVVCLLIGGPLLFLIVSLFGDKTSSVENEVQPVIEEVTLTDEALQDERQKLPVFTRTLNVASTTEDGVGEPVVSQDVSQARYIPLSALPDQADGQTDGGESPATDDDTAARSVSGAVSLWPSVDSQTVEPGTVTVSNDSSVKVGEVTVTNLAQTGELETIIRSGTVRILDFDKNIFVIGDPGAEPYQIHVTPQTLFSINGQQMTYAQLQRDDIVEVEGIGYADSVKLDATIVTVVGQYQRVDQPIN